VLINAHCDVNKQNEVSALRSALQWNNE